MVIQFYEVTVTLFLNGVLAISIDCNNLLSSNSNLE